MSDATTKRCSRCGETKALDAFIVNRDGLYGRHSQCSPCRNALRRTARALEDPAVEKAKRRARYERADKAAIAQRLRERRRANPELVRDQDARARERQRASIRARANAWGAANRDRIREQNQKYYASHRERERERGSAYKTLNIDVIRARSKAWCDANRDRRHAAYRAWKAAHPDKAHENRARYRARKLNAFVAPVSRRAIYERDGGRCGICGAAVSFRLMHLDHIIPLARGGTHEPKNVQVAHGRCNVRKYSTGPGQLRLFG